MKKLFLSLLIVPFIACASFMPKADTGYVITKDGQKIEFQNARMYDDQNSIFISDKYSTHTIMKRDIKTLHFEFNDKDYIFNH